METFDSVDDVLDFALATEIRAKEFYETMADKLEILSVCDLFEQFIKEESRHIAMIQFEIVKRGKVVPTMGQTSDLDDTAVMAAIEPGQDDLYEEAFRIAIERETQAVRQYIDFAIQVEDEELREMFIELAEEETRHKVLLKLEYDQFVRNAN